MWIEVLVDVYSPELEKSFKAGDVRHLEERIARLMVADGYAVYTTKPNDPMRNAEIVEPKPGNAPEG